MSKIEWTNETWNPATGCSKVSAGCTNCYMFRDWKRLSANPKTVYFNRKPTDIQTHDDRLSQPLRWKRPRRIFVNSMSDLFHKDIPFNFIDRVFFSMHQASQHTFQILTKRPERMREFFESNNTMKTFHSLPNVWLGVSVEDQKTADERIPLLLKTPAAIRFISYEPALGPVDFTHMDVEKAGDKEWCWINSLTGKHTDMGRPCPPVPTLDWVIAGGESGPLGVARWSDPKWFRSLRDQCKAGDVPFFMKQMTRKTTIPGDLLIRQYPSNKNG